MAAAALTVLAAPTEAAGASVEINPEAGPPGATVQVKGTGFGGSCGARIRWETLDGELIQVLGHAQVSAGAFSAEIVVPGPDGGDFVIAAGGLTLDAAGRCSAPTGPAAGQVFFVLFDPPPPPEANLTVSDPSPNPGELVKLDASGSSGEIKLFGFDLDANGSFETKCGSSAAGVIYTEAGSKQVGVQVVSTGGQTSVSQVQLNVSGAAAPPPPNPGGGSFMPFASGTEAGTCAQPGQSLVDLLIEAYNCPTTVSVGVATAVIPFGLPGKPCFERVVQQIKGGGGPLVRFVAKGTTVVLNGLRFNTLKSRLVVHETTKRVTATATKASDRKVKFTVKSPGYSTNVSTQPFEPVWDISKAGTVGHVTTAQAFGINTFLGLSYAAPKSTPLKLNGSGGAELNLFLELPLPKILFSSNASSNSLAVKVNGSEELQFAGGYSLKINDVYAGVFTLKEMTVSYQRQGSSDVWSGGLKLQFPAGPAAGGAIVVKNGVLESLTASITPGPPGLPIGCCIYVVEFGGTLTPSSISANATFAAGPEVLTNVRAAQAKGTATIYYEPFEFQLVANNVKVVNVSKDIQALVSITASSFWFQFHLNHGFGPFSFNAGVTASIGDGHWGVTGSGKGCVNVIIDACVTIKLAAGNKGVAGCGKISIKYLPDPAGGAVVYWGGGFGTYWGCSWSKVESKSGAASIAAARADQADAGSAAATFRVRVPRGLRKGLFAIRGKGDHPRVRVAGPGFKGIVTPDPGGASASGARWFATTLTNDDTTYVAVGRPRAGRWRITQLPGSAPVRSIGLARGLPAKVARGRVTGKGRVRTLRYRVKRAPGVAVTFVERGGPLTPSRPGQSVNRVIGKAKRARGRIRFVPADARTRKRRIEAVIRSQGLPVRTETVARFKAPKLRRLPGPKVRVRRTGKALVVRWSKVPTARRYRAVVNLTDRATVGFERGAGKRRLRIPGIGPLTAGRIEVRAISQSGYLSRAGTGRLRRVPPIRAPRRVSIGRVLRAGGLPVRCTASGDGTCRVELRKGRRVLARGSRAIQAGQTKRLVAKLTKAGRRALRRSRRLIATLNADVPGEAVRPLRIRLRAG